MKLENKEINQPRALGFAKPAAQALLSSLILDKQSSSAFGRETSQLLNKVTSNTLQNQK